MNKAREFEDFILDDYDFNLLEDWDLEYLWEWVELEDFSDLMGDFGGFNFDPDGTGDDSHSEQQPNAPPQDLIPPVTNSSMNEITSHEMPEANYDLEIDFDEESTHEEQSDDRYDVSEILEENQAPENQELPDLSNNHAVHDNEEANFLRSIGLLDEEGSNTEEQAHIDVNASLDTQNSSEEDDFLRSIGLLDEEEEDDDAQSSNDHNLEGNAENNNETLGVARYIETSAGTIDLETDDILAELQKVDFDEFIDVLQKNNYVFDKILVQQDWSEEEMEFLQSIEPLIRDQNKLQEIKDYNEDAPNVAPIGEGYDQLVDTQKYASLKDMFEALSENALKIAQNNTYVRKYQPKNIRKLWNLDTEDKQAKRISHLFGSESLVKEKTDTTPTLAKTRNNLFHVIKGVDEDSYKEIKEILTEEIKATVKQIDEIARKFIADDGKRFGFQFIDYLNQKYGSKIYYMLAAQLKNDLVAARLSGDIAQIILSELSPTRFDQFIVGFFEAIFITLENNEIDF